MAKVPARKPAPKKAEPATTVDGPTYRIAETYEEIPRGDGVMRVEAGHYVVDTDDGPLAMPPERFAEAYPTSEA